jgi:hypothetical protein
VRSPPARQATSRPYRKAASACRAARGRAFFQMQV